MDKVLTWGMRVTATCIFILGAIAVVSLATTGKFQFGALRGSARTINADLGGWGLALVILGIGSVLLGSSTTPARRTWWGRVSLATTAAGAGCLIVRLVERLVA